MIRSLFCLANASISGGNKVLLEYALRLKQRGQIADIHVWHHNRNLDWFDDTMTVMDGDIETIVGRNYDIVFFVKAFLIPLAFAHLGRAKPVFICQDLESAYVATSFDTISLDCQPFEDVLRLPIDIITTSKPVQKFLGERLNKEPHFVPLAIDRSMFKQQTAPQIQTERKRVLMVGDHLLPTKGIRDGLKALNILASEMPVELVLITREERGQQIFENLEFPCEIHVKPDAKEIQNIYASCDTFCCTSWYEGFGLPALEAFRTGIPVISTRNSGVENYGIDGENLLLCQPNNSEDMAEKLKRVLVDEKLRARLIAQGRKTEEQFDWTRTMEEFISCQQKILSSSSASITPPAPPVSNKQIQKLLQNLEENGLYTPRSVHEQCKTIFAKIDLLLAELSSDSTDMTTGLSELSKLRDQLKTHLARPAAEYYKSCKKRYDLCQLILSMQDDKRFHEHLGKLISRLDKSNAGNQPQEQPAIATTGSVKN